MVLYISKYISNVLYNSLDDVSKTRLNSNGFGIIDLKNRLKVLVIYLLMLPILFVVAFIFNIYAEVALSLVFVATIRLWNGGHHFKPDTCLVITTSVILILPALCYYLLSFTLYMALVALLLNLIFGPYSKINQRQFVFRKSVSILTCIIAYYFSDLLLVAMFVLSFDLIKWEKVGVRNVA